MDPVNCSPGVSQQASEVNALNFKLLYDDTSSDISINRKSLFRHQDAWETLRLRNSQFAASFDHALLAAVAIANQTGSTDNQAAITPIRTGIGDTMAAASYPANRTIDTATAGTAVAAEGQATASQALTDLMTQFISAMNAAAANFAQAATAILATATGGASSPSQTQPKPTESAG
jgi:hypothetical protein